MYMNEHSGNIQDLLKHINMSIRKVMLEEFSNHELTAHQLYILRVIKSNPKINYKYLGNELNLAKSSISLTIAKLINEGYVISKECQVDRRIKYLYLTELGERVLAETKKHSRNVFYQLIKSLSNEDLLNIEKQLTILKNTIDKAIDEKNGGTKIE